MGAVWSIIFRPVVVGGSDFICQLVSLPDLCKRKALHAHRDPSTPKAAQTVLGSRWFQVAAGGAAKRRIEAAIPNLPVVSGLQSLDRIMLLWHLGQRCVVPSSRAS